MEACSGAHFMGRQLREQGRDVRLMPPEYVQPRVKRDKTDWNDAEACAEACRRPTMRFVALKSEEQLTMQSLHRLCSRLVSARTDLVNQLRGFLPERGIAVPQGKAKLAAALPGILEDAGNGLPPRMREMVAGMTVEWAELDRREEELNLEVAAEARANEACRRADGIPGIGPLTATALVAAIGNGQAFDSGRDFAAWLRLTPREDTTGGKQRLGGISKRGNKYLRTLLVHGARAGLPQLARRGDGLGRWLRTSRSRFRRLRFYDGTADGIGFHADGVSGSPVMRVSTTCRGCPAAARNSTSADGSRAAWELHLGPQRGWGN